MAKLKVPSKPKTEKSVKRIKCIGIICLLLAAFLTQGCAYSHVQGPLDTNFDNTVLGSKIGRSHTQSVLWLFAWGNGGSKAAADEGGITTITHADLEYFIVLFGLYTRITTVVYGD
jgi:hypothetical protein